MYWIKTYYGVIERWFSRNLWKGNFVLGKAELGRKEVLGGRYYDSTRLKRACSWELSISQFKYMFVETVG